MVTDNVTESTNHESCLTLAVRLDRSPNPLTYKLFTNMYVQ